MNPTNRLRYFIENVLIPKYYLGIRTFGSTVHINCSNSRLKDGKSLDIVTIAYNNEMVIKQQHRLLEKYILDDFHYTVADNSNDPKKREKIIGFCRESGLGYIGLPPNPYEGAPSKSHGFALNWIYRNYISPRQPFYFGFLDHDIFPISPIRLTDILQKYRMYGLVQTRKNIWYLWPGLSFFQFNFLKIRKIDFMPYGNADTGGGNWTSVYRGIDRSNIREVSQRYEKLREGNDPQSDFVEFLDDWVHTFNASYWKQIDNKDNLVEIFLNSF